MAVAAPSFVSASSAGHGFGHERRDDEPGFQVRPREPSPGALEARLCRERSAPSQHGYEQLQPKISIPTAVVFDPAHKASVPEPPFTAW